jgi:hypothetical protein
MPVEARGLFSGVLQQVSRRHPALVAGEAEP